MRNMIDVVSMGSTTKAMILVQLVLGVMIQLGMAANYTVGGPNGGWDQSTDLTSWASSNTFFRGDTLIFQYTTNHNVVEVSKQDFDSCSPANPLQPRITGGLAAIPLTTTGTRYFICGTAGHCISGMKLQIDILAQTPPPLATPSSPPPRTTTKAAASPKSPSLPPATTKAAASPNSSPPPKAASPKSPSLPPATTKAAASPNSSPPPKAASPDSPPPATNNPVMPPSTAAGPLGGSLSRPPMPSSDARFNVAGVLSTAGLLIAAVF